MSSRPTAISDALYQYLLSVSLREPEIMRRLREETSEMPGANMQIAPDQGQFMALLVELIGARRTIEIGTFTGYSALAVARALPKDGRVVACDVSEEYTSVARRYWKEAGVADKIELRIGPGLNSLDALIKEGKKESFDFAFIDADKANYQGYYDRCMTLVRKGGLIAVDNVLWNGAVIDPAKKDEDTAAIRRFNEALKKDERVSLSMLPIADGLTLARKR
ncbi:MAG: SAM-dependent methyltransferase [Rhodospirillales bacterium]|nr:SAM-dependent methyltransferase [Rhodospirillales bacterium]